MMALAGPERAQLRQQLSALEGKLKLEYFHQSRLRVTVPGRAERPSCEAAKELYEDLAELSDKLQLTVIEHSEEPELAERRDVIDVPCLLIRGELNRPLRFYGAPNGHLLVALIRALALASARQAKPSAVLKRVLGKLRRPSRLRVMGSAQDPNSGQAALAACAVGLLSPKLQVDVFEIDEFAPLAQRAGISGTPATFVDEQPAGLGLIEPLELAEYIRLCQSNPARAQLNPPASQAGTVTAWRPPAPPQGARRAPARTQPAGIDPIAAAAGRAREATPTPEGMRRTAGGLIVPDR